MIVPIISFAELQNTDCKRSDGLFRRLSLFGRAAIRLEPTHELSEVEQVIMRFAGETDTIVLVNELNEPDAIEYLNAGATQVLFNQGRLENHDLDDRIRPNDCEIKENELSDDLFDKLLQGWTDQVYLVQSAVFDDWAVRIVPSLLQSDRPDGMWPTVIVDSVGLCMGLAYSNVESLEYAIRNRVGCYWSRSRNELWIKGATSGSTQLLRRICFDCDQDAIQFVVEQSGTGFCHKGTHSCFGEQRSIMEIFQRLQQRVSGADEKSFTKKLYSDPEMLRKKLLEEAQELSDADNKRDAVWEAADVLYFSMIAMLRNGVEFDDVFSELARRMQRVVRRKNKLENNDNE